MPADDNTQEFMAKKSLGTVRGPGGLQGQTAGGELRKDRVTWVRQGSGCAWLSVVRTSDLGKAICSSEAGLASTPA